MSKKGINKGIENMEKITMRRLQTIFSTTRYLYGAMNFARSQIFFMIYYIVPNFGNETMPSKILLPNTPKY